MSFDPQRAMAEGWVAFQAGDHRRAEVLLQQVMKAQPGNVPAMVALGLIESAAGREAAAERRMREVLKLDKNCLPALKWMGQNSLNAGQAEKATEFAEQAVRLAPINVEALELLGSCYFAQKRFQDALACFERATDLAPGEGLLRYRKAQVLEKLMRDAAAIEELEIALQLSPSQEGLVRLARVQLHAGRVEQAIESCKRALRNSAGDATAHVLMARSLMETGRMDEADRHWDSAKSLRPHSADVGLERVRSLNRLGHFEDATTESMRVIDLDERAGAAYYALVSGRVVTERDRPLIDKMEKLIRDPTLDNRSRIGILFALGKSYDNLGEYETAMSHFDEANQLENTHFMEPFDKHEFKQLTDEQLGVFTPGFFEQNRGAGLESNLPLFVIGMMRSGTTLAEQILTCHSKIGGAGEQSFWVDHGRSVVDWETGSVLAEKVRALGEEYLALLKKLAPGFSLVCDKNPANLMVVGAVHLAFPNARILHMRRNPIDTALSIWMTPMQTAAPFVSNRENIVFAYKEYLRLIEHWRSVLPGSQFLEIDYESLIEDPATVTRRMTDFLGLDWEDECLHHERNPQLVRTPSFWQVRQPLYKTSAEKWRHYEPWLGAFGKLEGSR